MKYLFSLCLVLFVSGFSFAQTDDARLQERAAKSELQNTQQQERDALKNLEAYTERFREAVKIKDKESAYLIKSMLLGNYARLTDARVKLNTTRGEEKKLTQLQNAASDEKFLEILEKAFPLPVLD